MSRLSDEHETNNSTDDDETNESKSLLRNNHTKFEYRYNSLNGEGGDDSSSDLNHNNNNNNNNNGISWYFAVFLIVNAALGAGLLNFAKAFDNAGGILVSSLVQIVSNIFPVKQKYDY